MPNSRRPEFLRRLRVAREAAGTRRARQSAPRPVCARYAAPVAASRAVARRRANAASAVAWTTPANANGAARRFARGETSCPRCGAALRMPEEVSHSGWAQLPGRKDMAKLQFGNSFCQIEGVYVPVADMKLAPEDSVYFTHHVLLWKDPQVNITTMSLKGGWKRIFAGLPLIMTQAQGPGHIAFSKDDPGELIAVPLQPGEAVDVREHMFLVATGNVQYDWFNTGIWFQTQNGDDTETHYPIGMFMDRFAAPQAPGLLLLHAAGNVFVRDLGQRRDHPGQAEGAGLQGPHGPNAIALRAPQRGVTRWGSWGNRYMWLLLSGPGRVAIQSVYPPVEGENARITGLSRATQQQW